ncbi:MAG TPA: CehA/McbA family metallohydrolase, partial [Candidatus Acidoferrum sp.]|nr:CehA/McbA family metallohydrolase [Candidatus Acidoferrum sp.]
ERRHWLHPHSRLEISVRDALGKLVPARISVTDERGRFHGPDDALIYADDGFDREQRPFEAHYFYSSRGLAATVDVPEGRISVEVSQGFEYKPQQRTVDTSGQAEARVNFVLSKLDWERGRKTQWASGDLHVHMNYGGTYRSERDLLLNRAEGEGVQIVNNLVVNKEQRVPDIGSQHFDEILKYVSSEADVVLGQEFHTSYWGHRGILRLRDHFLLPGYAGYPNTAAASLFPMNADVYDMAHEQGALVGAVHPFDEVPDPFAKPAQRITDELPVDVALGKLDYMEIVGFSDHKSTAAVWYRLLNLGYRMPAGAGTDATTNYAAPIRGNAGFDRVYAVTSGDGAHGINLDSWMDSLQHGRTFATNGPLITFTLNGETVGSELKLEKPRQEVPFTARLRSIVPVDHLEAVCNGQVVKDLKWEGARDTADVKGTIPLTASGWCLLRAYSDKAVYPVLDNYAYATTSPVYVTVAGAKPRSPEDAKYFAAWIARVTEITGAYPDWNSPQEKALVLKRLEEAKKIYEAME